MRNIESTISEGIKRGKWIDISYKNFEKDTTYFWIGIKDIDLDNKILYVDIFNSSKGLDCLDVKIHFDRILSARILDFTIYNIPQALYDKLENNKEKAKWLKYESYNNNILRYYEECNKLDTDPFQKSSILLPGIDTDVLLKQEEIKLSDKQTYQVINYIKMYDVKKLPNELTTLAISRLAISIGDKDFIVIYYDVLFDPTDKTIRIDSTPRVNLTFLIEGYTYSLSTYINMDSKEFVDNITIQPEIYIKEYTELIRENLTNGAIINEMPEFMILSKQAPVNLNDTYNTIIEKMYNNTLEYPLKAFFGNTNNRYGIRSKEPNIVILDDKVNIDQMRVIYNVMKYPITYVQGPPGTGKTQTIINVILSNFLNEKSLIICSSNNKPINNIVSKLKMGYDANEESPIPYLRLGNRSVVAEATKRIRKLYDYPYTEEISDDLIKQLKDSTDKSNTGLVDKLSIYEQKQELKERMDAAYSLLKILNNPENRLYNSTIREYNQLLKEYNTLPDITNEEVLSLVSSVKDNRYFRLLMFYLSIKYIRKLRLPRYEELIGIVSIKDDDERVTEFNKWCSNDNNIKLLEDAFPIIVTTNISSARLGTANHTFDLLIMDEAGQCNVATSLLAISRTKKLLLVGDSNQLKPVILLEDAINQKLKKEFKITNDYDYSTNSILDIMRNHDKISKDIMLSYHYRCGIKIINFSNQRFYNNELNLEALKEDGHIELINVNNVNSKKKNEQYEEARTIIDYIKRNNIKDAAIVTPFVNQQQLINKMLQDEHIENITCGTVHKMQGDEKNTIIISTALSPKTSKKTFQWLKNNKEITNVAVTRAKKNLIIVNDNEALNLLSDDKEDDLSKLIEYVKNNGEITIPPNPIATIQYGSSNGSKKEDEFFDTMSQFCSINNIFEVKRNVKLSTLFASDEILSKSKLEFDIVLYKIDGTNLIPKIAIELQGGEHLGDENRERCDNRKVEICKEKGIKLIEIPNSFSKSYETIKDLLLTSCGLEREQLQLF